MKKFFLLVVLLAVFVSKVSYAQLMVNDIDQSISPGSFTPLYGFIDDFAIIQVGNLPSDATLSMMSVTANGYVGTDETFLGYSECDDLTIGYADISSYYLNFIAYDYVEVLYELVYSDGSGTHYWKHLVTFIYAPH